MRKIANWASLRILRDWKIRSLLLLFLLFFGSFSLFYRQQNLTFPESEMEEEYQDEREIYRLIPQSHFESELGQEVQRTLGSNSVALGVNAYILKQREGNKVGGIVDLPDYIENGQEIVENNMFLHEAKDFESHDLLLREYLPALEEVEQQERFYDALLENDLEVEWNYFSAAQILKVEVELLAGFLLFLLIAIFASDHFTKDQVNHWSVTHGIPVPWKTQWRTRSLLLFSLFWLVLLGAIAISFVIGNLVDTSGSLMYPAELYFENGIHYIPLWQYVLLVIIMAMLLSYLLMLLTTGLSWFTRNFYLTILIVSGLFLLPQLWEFIPAISSWQPSLYLDLMGVIDGTTATNTGIQGIVWWKAPIIYLGMIAVLEGVFSSVFSKIPTTTAGLQRRVNA